MTAPTKLHLAIVASSVLALGACRADGITSSADVVPHPPRPGVGTDTLDRCPPPELRAARRGGNPLYAAITPPCPL
jgi:hypothetical protein